MFITDVLKKAGQKVIKDTKALGTNTKSVVNAVLENDKDRLNDLSLQFATAAGVGATVILMKKTGLGIINNVISGDDILEGVLEGVSDIVENVNPLVVGIVGANAVMAVAAKVAADEELRTAIVNKSKEIIFGREREIA